MLSDAKAYLLIRAQGIGRPTSLADSIKQKSEFKPKTDQKAERRVPIPSEVEVPRGGKRKAAIAIGGESEGEEQALVTGEKRRKRYSIDLEPEKPRVKEREKGKFTAKGEQEVEDMILGEERRKRISLQKELAKAKGETKAKVKAALEAGQPIEDVITPEKKKAKVIEEASPKAARMRLTEEEVEPERLAKKAKDKARMTALKEVEDEEVEPERVARKAKDKVKMKTLKEEGDDEIEGLVRGKTKKTMGIDEEPAKATAKGADKVDIEELDDRIQRLETQTKRAETQKDKKRIEVDGDEEVLRGGRKSKKALDSGVDDRLPGDPRKSDKALDAGIDDRLPTSKRNRRARLNDSIDDDYDMRGQMSGGGGMGGFNTPAQAKMLRRQGKQQQLGMMDQQPMQDPYEDYAYPLANQRQQQTLGRSDHKRGATAQLRRQDLQLDGETSDEDPTAPFNPRKKDTKTTGEPGGKERRDKLKGKKKNAAAIGDHGSEDDGNSDGDPKQVRNPDQKKGMAKKGVDAAAPKNEKSDGDADSDDNGLDSDLETLLREEKGNFLSSRQYHVVLEKMVY
jgi:hypothetical protein